MISPGRIHLRKGLLGGLINGLGLIRAYIRGLRAYIRGYLTRNKKGISKQATTVLIKIAFIFTGF